MTALAKPPQEAFAHAYVTNGYDSRKAAAISGLSAKAVDHPLVRRRISELMEAQFAPHHVDAERVVRRLAQIAFQDVRDLFDEHGRMLNPHELGDDAAASISAIDVKMVKEGDGLVEIRKIRRPDPIPALNILAKHLKVIGDDDNAVNNLADALAQRLDAARKRTERKLPDVEVVPTVPEEDTSLW